MSSPPAHGSGSEGAQEKHDQDALDHALQVASRNGHLAEVLALLEAGADVNGQGPDGEGNPPLHAASEYGNIACVRALLAAGAEIDKASGVYGRTALSLAAFYGQTDVVRCLLEAGASHDVGLEQYGVLLAGTL
jgi:ankyrin repeat protein